MRSPRSLPRDQKGAQTIRSRFVAVPVSLVITGLLLGALPAAAAVDPGVADDSYSTSDAIRKVGLGVSIPEGNRSIAAVDAFTASMGGRKPATWTIWSQWGNPDTKKFPSGIAKKLKARGITPNIWWEPMVSEDRWEETGYYSRFKRIIKGKHDAYIKSFARAAKKHKGPVLLRFAHEINASYFPWSTRWSNWENGNSPKVVKKAWRRIYNLFQKVGAKNVRFLWTVAKQSSSGNPYAKLYPGDRYVHYVGFSNFNWGDFEGRTWASFTKGVKPVMKKFAQFTRKPILVAELASSDIGGDKPAWIKNGYPAVYKAYPRIKGIIYLNADLSHVDHPNWSLTSPPAALDAYRDVRKQKRFGGKIR